MTTRGALSVWFHQNPLKRRLFCAAVLLVLLVLGVLPRSFIARVKVMPPQNSNAGMGALLSQLGGLASFASLVGGRQPTEVYLVVARSNDVAVDVLKRLQKTEGAKTPESTRMLAKWMDIHSLRGGVIEFEATGTDPDLAQAITKAYATAFQDRLSSLAKEEITRKKALMADKLAMASQQLVTSEAAMTRFRTGKRIASAEGQLGASVSLLAALRARLQAKEVELAMTRQFTTSQNYTEQRIEAEVSSLRKQISESDVSTEKNDPFGFQRFTADTAEYVRLYRDLKYAEALFEVYSRFSESVNVEEMSSSLNAQIIESPYLDPNRRWNVWALGLAILVLIAAAYLEFDSRRYLARAEF